MIYLLSTFLTASIALSSNIPNILESSGFEKFISLILEVISISKGIFSSLAEKYFAPTTPYIAGSLNILGSINETLFISLNSRINEFTYSYILS